MPILREEVPSSYLMKMVGFSEIKLSILPYESAVFEASGHKWRLIFYPAGNIDGGGKDHVSIYARIENVDASEVPVELKFFVYNHNIKKYSVFQDGTVKSYNKVKTEWGIAQMIPVSEFNDPSNGYIDGDACIIGVEIFVTKPIESVVFIQNPPNNKFTWKITNFSKLGDQTYYYSDEFVVGDREWRLMVNPKGYKNVRALSVYLQAMAYLPNAVCSSKYARIKFRLLNQKNSNHVERRAYRFFPSKTGTASGIPDLIYVEDLNDESKGYLVKDSIVLEVSLISISETKFVNSI